MSDRSARLTFLKALSANLNDAYNSLAEKLDASGFERLQQEEVKVVMGWALEDARASGTGQDGEAEGKKATATASNPITFPPSPFSTSPPANDGERAKLTLVGLPSELKILIVEKVAELEAELEEEEEQREEDEEEEVADDEISPLSAMAMVNKEFASYAQAYLWRDVDVRFSTTEELVFFTTVLPKYRHHIKSLRISVDSPQSFTETETLEDDVETDGATLPLCQFMLALAVLLTPKLETVELELVRSEYETTVLKALMLIGRQLIDVTLSGTEEEIDDSDLVGAIETFPNLKRLRLEGIVGVDPTQFQVERKAILAAIASLQQLELLSLEDASLATDDLAALDWQSSLKILALDSCPEMSAAGTIALIKKHSATLEGLDLRNVPENLTRTEKKMLINSNIELSLPQLGFLMISTPHPIYLLTPFNRCATKMLTIGYCPEIKPEHWKKFITLHQRSLDMVCVEAIHGWNEEETESFAAWCEMKKINLEIEEDSEEEFNDEENEDEDAEEGEWSDDE